MCDHHTHTKRKTSERDLMVMWTDWDFTRIIVICAVEPSALLLYTAEHPAGLLLLVVLLHVCLSRHRPPPPAGRPLECSTNPRTRPRRSPPSPG